MKEIIRPPKQLYLPRNQFEGLTDYETYPSHEPKVIAKRRAHPGTLIADQEMRGIQIFDMLDPARFDTPQEQRAASEIREHTGLGSSYYGLRNNTTMYSVLTMGLIADGTRTYSSERFHTTQEEHADRMHKFTNIAGMLAVTRYEALKQHTDPERAAQLSRHIGRNLGNAALHSRVHDMPGRFTHLHPVDIQLMVRDRSVDLLEEVIERSHMDGALPSVAQLAEPDSPVAVHIRRQAPSAVRKAYEQALSDNPEITA